MQRDFEQALQNPKTLNVFNEWLDQRCDAKWSDQIQKLDAKWEARFEKMEGKWEARFDKMEAKWEARFEKLEAKLEEKLNFVEYLKDENRRKSEQIVKLISNRIEPDGAGESHESRK